MTVKRVFFIILCVVLLLLLGSVAAFELYHAERFYPGVSVWGVDVGGMRPDEAAGVLEKDLGLDALLIKLYGPDRSWSIHFTDLGLDLDPWATLVSPYYLGRDRSWMDNLLTHVRLLAYGEDFPPIVVYNEDTARLYLETLAEQVDLPAADAAISLDGLTPVVTSAQAGRYVDVDATLATLTPAVIRLAPAEIEMVVHEIPPSVADAEPARAEAEALLDGPLTLVLKHPREGDPGPWVISPEELAAMLAIREDGGELHAELDVDALQFFLEGLTTTLAIEPVDARFHFNDALGQLEPISPSVEGRALDAAASTTRIVQELTAGNRHVPLIVEAVPPRYPDTATAEELGIVELVAEGDSYFIGSPSGRDHNIRLATPKFDGIVVGPGETFSFNHYLGEVSAEAGYDESYVTTGEQLAIEVGGGICQVSTTAFRAAFWGGYPIVGRWYHRYRVGYYELMGAGVGMDATVYSPLVDFKFTNDRPYPLLIETEIEEGAHRLVFRFYSTGDGRRVEKGGPKISDETEPGPPIYQLDEELAPGTVIQWQRAVGGLTATVERGVYDAAGNLLYDDTFVSKYASRRAAYHYGPGYEPPPESEPGSEEETEP
ncbi:MAG: VanW family protein [Chloroflexota bacterium]|nr:VanW family protein [Chloroflexota bacterium]